MTAVWVLLGLAAGLGHFLLLRKQLRRRLRQPPQAGIALLLARFAATLAVFALAVTQGAWATLLTAGGFLAGGAVVMLWEVRLVR